MGPAQRSEKGDHHGPAHRGDGSHDEQPRTGLDRLGGLKAARPNEWPFLEPPFGGLVTLSAPSLRRWGRFDIY